MLLFFIERHQHTLDSNAWCQMVTDLTVVTSGSPEVQAWILLRLAALAYYQDQVYFGKGQRPD